MGFLAVVVLILFISVAIMLLVLISFLLRCLILDFLEDEGGARIMEFKCPKCKLNTRRKYLFFKPRICFCSFCGTEIRKQANE